MIRTEAYLLVPWIFVYLIGICSSYIGAAILLISQVNKKERWLVYSSSSSSPCWWDDWNPHPLDHQMDEGGAINSKLIYPLATAVVFHLAWLLVKGVFDDLKNSSGDRRVGGLHFPSFFLQELWHIQFPSLSTRVAVFSLFLSFLWGLLYFHFNVFFWSVVLLFVYYFLQDFFFTFFYTFPFVLQYFLYFLLFFLSGGVSSYLMWSYP